MHKIISLAIIMVILLGLIVGCSSGTNGESGEPKSNEISNNEPSVEFPGNNPITLIVPWNPGGGSDVGARILQPYLEEALGTNIVVTNPVGASGWIGWEMLLSQKADGYTIALVNFPTLFSGYLDPSLGRDKTIDDFQMLANHVSDFCVIAVRKDDERFPDIESFVEYAKDNEVTIASAGVGTDDHILIESLKKQGLNLTMVPGNGWKDSYAALLGGHVDAAASNVGEVLVPHKDGEILTLCVFAKERSDLLPEVPTWNETGVGEDMVSSSQRGFACKAGTPQEIVDTLSGALETAINNQEQIKKMAEMGLVVDYMGPKEYTKHLKEEEQRIKNLANVMGWQ